MKLESILEELKTFISKSETINTRISHSSIGWQIEHILLTINQVVSTTKASNSSNYQPKFSVWKLIVLNLKRIPRGKVKAPKIVRPETFDENSLKMHIQQTLENIFSIQSIQKNQYFNHPIFGLLNKNKMIVFLEVHSFHHLKIIRDILKQSN